MLLSNATGSKIDAINWADRQKWESLSASDVNKRSGPLYSSRTSPQRASKAARD